MPLKAVLVVFLLTQFMRSKIGRDIQFFSKTKEKNMSILYNEDYFHNGEELGISCYSNYRWLPEITLPFAFRLIEELGIKSDDTILDYGCAKGYLVKALRLLHRHAFGYDNSEWAIDNAPIDVLPYLFHDCPRHSRFDWLICKDVLEHLHPEELHETLRHLWTISDRVFCIIPLGNGERFICPENDKDKTHIIKLPMEWWINVLKEYFIIESAVYEIPGMKERHTSEYKNSVAFITMRSY